MALLVHRLQAKVVDGREDQKGKKLNIKCYREHVHLPPSWTF